MSLHFVKMHGCGNDFLFLDCMKDQADDVPEFTPDEIAFLCDRNFGVGADGLVLLEKGRQWDAKWTFFNSDGSIAEMCGNAARCAIRFLHDKYYPISSSEQVIAIETKVGVIKGRPLNPEGDVEVSLLPKGAVDFKFEERVIKRGSDLIQAYFLWVGVPHAVIEVKEMSDYPIEEVGRFLVNHPAFEPDGTNVTFVQRGVGSQITVTTFERGVEKETFACGTGAAAASIVISEVFMQGFPFHVKMPGGQLEVDISPVAKVVLLRGPTQYVCEVATGSIPRNFVRPSTFGSQQRSVV